MSWTVVFIMLLVLSLPHTLVFTASGQRQTTDVKLKVLEGGDTGQCSLMEEREREQEMKFSKKLK